MLTYADAINRALREAMAADRDVILMGEGAHDPVPVFGTQQGLLEEFGPDRVIEMPTAEAGLVGCAIGAALAGKRPVVSFHRIEFALLAAEQILNNAAKLRWLSCGKHKVPLLLRLVVGRGWGQGPVHAQSLESVFASVPGLRVVLPAVPRDAYAMTKAALHDDEPTVMIEHRWCHGVSGEIPEQWTEASPAPFDGPRRLRGGGDITIVASSFMAIEARRACDRLNDCGISCDLFDLRVARPLHTERIVKSACRSRRLLVVDLGHELFGLGAEIVAQTVACDSAIRVKRLGLPDRPTPSSRHQVSSFYPDAETIATAAEDLVGGWHLVRVDSASLRRPHVDQPDASFMGPF